MQKKKPSGVFIGLLSLGILIAAAITASITQAASSNGPYYATPSWDQKLPTATRFIVLTDWNSAAVLDRETGLVWERFPTTTLENPPTWNNARVLCINKDLGGRKGWRLPSIPELASLVDLSAPGNFKLPQDGTFGAQVTNHWSSTSDAGGDPTVAWVVNVFDGNVGTDVKTHGNQARCVRGGMNADAY